MTKLLTVFLLIITISVSGNQISLEDLEIKKIKDEIKILEIKLKKVEEKKIKNLKTGFSRKKVGLVLSGGGAKGLAHIGVLRELEKNNIKVDYITGTSMGAIIGALYAIGYTPDGIEEIIKTTDLEGLFKGEDEEVKPSLKNKLKKSDSIIRVKYDNNFKFTFPKGFTDGNASYFKLKEILNGYNGYQDFDKLPIPMRIITTDLSTGEAVALREGDLARAISASMAIPTLMNPVRIGEKEYIDGMIGRNFPVQDVMDMGADIIIGSDVSAELAGKDHYNILTVLEQLLTLQTTAGNAEQKKLTTVLIIPKLEKYTATQFKSAKEIIKSGEVAANENISKILNFVTPDNVTENDLVKNDIPTKNNDIFINSIKFLDEKDLNIQLREIIKGSFKNILNKKVSDNKIEKIFAQLYSLDAIDRIYYTIDYKKGIIEIDVDPNPTNTVGVGMNYRSDYGMTLKIDTEILKMGKVGSLTDVELKIGDYFGIKAKNFSYYGHSNKIGLISEIGYEETPLFLYKDGSKNTKFKNKDLFLTTGISTQIWNQVSLFYGLKLNSTALSIDTGGEEFEYETYNTLLGDAFLTAFYDSTNNRIFPTSGGNAELTVTWGASLFEEEEEINYYGSLYSGKYSHSIGKNLAFNFGIAAGTINGDSIPLNKFIKLGGGIDNIDKREFNFTGYNYQEKIVDKFLLFKLGVQYELYNNLYLTGNFNVGTFDEVRNSNIKMWDDYIRGYEIGLGYDSLIGPITLGISTNSDKKNYIYRLNIGYYLD